MNQDELLAKLDGLGEITDVQRNDIACALIGHSHILTHSFGYWYCARCGAQVGDSIGGIYRPPDDAVLVGHNCEQCHANYDAMGWEHKLFCPDPFADDSEEGE